MQTNEVAGRFTLTLINFDIPATTEQKGQKFGG